MKVTLLQTDIAWGEPEENLRRAEKLMAEHPGSDLYVLPEMFTTGFATSSDSKIDEDPSRTLAWMKRIASEGDCAVAGSVALRDGEKCYNRLFFVEPDGRVTTYDKRHLFTFGGERERFSPGDKRVIVEFRGWRFLLLVCYDLRFPVWSKCRGEYDAIICVANWPEARQRNWETLAEARAVENQCYALAVNRVGEDPVCKYLGGTAVVHPFGDRIVRCPDGVVSAVTAELDLKFLSIYRKSFTAIKDGDDFQIVL